MNEDGTKELDPNDLEPHPVNEGMFPADPDRELAVEDEEFQEAPQVTTNSHYTDADFTIISGHRRVKTAKQEGWETVEVQLAGPYESKDEERAAILRANDYRQMTPGEQVNFAQEWEEMYRSRPDLDGRADEMACEHVEFGRTTYNKGKRVKQAAKEGTWGDDETELNMQTRSTARDLWQALCDGEESIHGTHETLKAAVGDGNSGTADPVEVPDDPRGAVSESGYTEEELEECGITDPVQAVIQTTVDNLDRFLRTVSLGRSFISKNAKEYVHLQVLNEKIVIRSAAPDETASNRLELESNYFKTVECKIDPPVGMSVRVDDIRGLLDVLDNSLVTVEFRGESDGDITNHVVVTNEEQYGWFAAPDDRETFEDAPPWLPELDQNRR